MARLASATLQARRSLPRSASGSRTSNVPGKTEALLRELAFVLHATRSVRSAIDSGDACVPAARR
jgi:hypothetical protein